MQDPIIGSIGCSIWLSGILGVCKILLFFTCDDASPKNQHALVADMVFTALKASSFSVQMFFLLQRKTQ